MGPKGSAGHIAAAVVNSVDGRSQILNKEPHDSTGSRYLYETQALENKSLRCRAEFSLRIPMMSITQSDLMPISLGRSDAGLSQCETVIGISQEFSASDVWFRPVRRLIAKVAVRSGVAPGAYPGPTRRTGSEAMAE